MDALRKKYKRGQIDQKTYREKVTELTILHLESIDYKYVGKIADGTHGIVVELKSPDSALNVAVKIVIDELASDNEINMWPKLINDNILPLIKYQNIIETNTNAFFTIKHPATLVDKLEEVPFLGDGNGFNRAISCVKDITNGINYLHQQGLCHLNLKTDHIFIKYNNTARIGGFGYLTSAKAEEFKCGTSAVFRPPEVYHSTNEERNGEKFDIWSLGILTTEIFTGQFLTQSISKLNKVPSDWYYELYEIIFDVLKKDRFKALAKKMFIISSNLDSKLDQVINFITSCLSLRSGDRPSAGDLLKHKLFGGHIEKLPMHPNIWVRKYTPVDLLLFGMTNEDFSVIENDVESSENVDATDEIIDKSKDSKNTCKISNKNSHSENLMKSANENVKNHFAINNKICEKSQSVKKEIDQIIEKQNISHPSDVYSLEDFGKSIDAGEHEKAYGLLDAFNNAIQTEKEETAERIHKMRDNKFFHDTKSLSSHEINSLKSCKVQEEVEKPNKRENSYTSDADVLEASSKLIDAGEVEKAYELLAQTTYDINTVTAEDELKVSMVTAPTNDEKFSDENKSILMEEACYCEDGNMKNDKEQEILNTISIPENSIIKNDDDNNYSDFSNVSKEPKCESNSANQINKIKQSFNTTDIINNIEITKNETEIKENTTENVNPSKNDECKHEFENKSPIPKEIIDKETHAKDFNLKYKKTSNLKQESTPAYASNADSMKLFQCRDNTKRKRKKKKHPFEKYALTTSLRSSIQNEHKNTDQRSRYYIGDMSVRHVQQNMTEDEQASGFSSPMNITEKFEFSVKNKKMFSLKVRPSHKAYKIKQDIKSSCDSTGTSQSSLSSGYEKRSNTNKKQFRKIRKTPSLRTVPEIVRRSPATSSAMEVTDDDYELEPGEIPLFRKDYEKIIDKSGPEYSRSSLSAVSDVSNEDYELEPGETPFFRKIYEKRTVKSRPYYYRSSLNTLSEVPNQDLVKGEINPNNLRLDYNVHSGRDHVRFKKLRSWWKRQKKTLTTIFGACIPMR